MTADGVQPAGDAEPLGLASVNARPATRDEMTQPSTGLHAALLENEQLKRQLAAVTDELESFTYSVSHDLRASLRHISAFVEIVNEDWRSAGAGDGDASLHSGIGDHLATITNAARHMTLMIDALMELSRLGRVELNLSRVDLRPLIDEVFEALQPETQADTDTMQAVTSPLPIPLSSPLQASSIQWRIADDFPALHADPMLVRQLLQHLISNAIKFTRSSAGRPPAQVEIGWRWLPDDARGGMPRRAPLCELFVKDNGVGFNPKFGSKLFGVFQRLHSASEFEGIGMGLALSRKIVERNGGGITASSPVAWAGLRDSGGCEVRFTLPPLQSHSVLKL